tara:strand:- start:20 stop:841 length:822 start_codon:yes stop_codon:yes gene_type:complete
MFRKGGDVGGGIMDNVVERRNYAVSNANDLGVKDVGVKLSDSIDTVMAAGGDKSGLGDPLTQFLLSYGPALASQTGAGSTIGNIVAAAKEPTADLLKDIRSQKKTRQAIALDLYKDLSDSDKIALQEKVEYLMDTFGLSKEEALNRTLPEFRKKRDPLDQAALDYSSTVDSIIKSTNDSRGNPRIDSLQAGIIVDNLKVLEKANPEAYSKFVGTQSKNKYIFGSGEYTPEGDIIKDSILADLPDGVIVYDIEKAKFVKKQGNKVIEVVSVTEE